jgi:hypothetical protein
VTLGLSRGRHGDFVTGRGTLNTSERKGSANLPAAAEAVRNAVRGWIGRAPVQQTPAFANGRSDPERSTVFLHVPKCAGTAFSRSLRAALSATTILGGFDLCLFDGFAGIDQFSPEIKKFVHLESPMPRADLVSGHFALSTLRREYPDGNYCTILREPLSRLLSNWLYWRQHGDDELAGWSDWADRVRRARQPFAAFLADPVLAPHMDNLAVRMLLWPDPRLPADGFIEPKHEKSLSRDALARLRALNFVDYLENPALLNNVGDWLGASFTLPRVNETRQAPEAFPVDLFRELTPECYRLLETRCRIDLVLWTEVVKARGAGMETAHLQESAWRDMVRHHQAIQRQLAAA